MNKKLNIVFLDFDDIKNPILGGGQAKATVEVGKRLVKMGHSLTVICSKFPGYQDRFENGIRYIHIGIGTRNIKLNNILYILLLPIEVVKQRKVDIILECFTAPISTLFSPLFTKIPVVALTTSFEADMFSSLYHFPLFKHIEKIGLKQYQYFIAYTKHYEKKIKKYNKYAIVKIIPEGVGEEFFKIKKKTPEFILFLGRLDIGQKGIDLLLEAYSKVKDKIDYSLVIAGNGPDELKIRKIIKSYNLGKKVKMIGPTFGSKKFNVLSRSLFVAFPSRHEGFPLFSLEALASSLPLVAFDIPGLSWTNINVCLKAKKYNTDEYSKLLLLATKKSVVNKMSISAKKFAKNYSWDNVASSFESFFYEISLHKK